MARVLLTLPGEDELAVVTAHALDRWREYVCPLHPRARAVELLKRVVTLAGAIADEPPEWVVGGPPGRRYLVAGDFAFVLARMSSGTPMVLTIIPRGSLPRVQREARNAAAAARRRSRAVRRRHSDARGGVRAERRGARADDPVDYTPGNHPKEEPPWRP